MKRILFLLTMSLSVFLVSAQKMEDIKNQLVFNKFKEAKVDLDKGMSNPKFNSKAEAFMLKSVIYAGLAGNLMNINIGMSKDDIIKRLGQPKNATKTTTGAGTTEMLFYEDYAINLDEKGKVDWINQSGNTSGVKGTNEMLKKMDELTNEADGAFKKYKEMEPALTLIIDPIYQNGPINIYSSYYSSGYSDYNGKNWLSAYNKFKKAAEYSDLLIEKKLFQSAIDTNVLILAGITAENSGNKEDAVKYYSRLADNKVTGDGFESVYRYLVSYYFGKKDLASFEKYKDLGKQMFPKSEYFNYDKVDFAVGLQEKFEDKIKAVEEVLATDPNNFKANEVLGEVIYEALNPIKDTVAIPANAAELEGKMVAAFNKAAAVKADYEVPYLFIGDHFINKAVKANDAREKHAADMKTRTKPGTMASKEDVAKREALDKSYGAILEMAMEPYQKASAIFAARAKLEPKDKQQYKKAASYLADIFTFKKVQAKGKPADVAKYTAEEEKWNKIWDSIK